MSHVLKADGIIFDVSKADNIKRLKTVITRMSDRWLGENIKVHMYQGDI